MLQCNCQAGREWRRTKEYAYGHWWPDCLAYLCLFVAPPMVFGIGCVVAERLVVVHWVFYVLISLIADCVLYTLLPNSRCFYASGRKMCNCVGTLPFFIQEIRHPQALHHPDEIALDYDADLFLSALGCWAALVVLSFWRQSSVTIALTLAFLLL